MSSNGSAELSFCLHLHFCSDARFTVPGSVLGPQSPMASINGVASSTPRADYPSRSMNDPIQLLLLTDDVTTPYIAMLAELASRYARQTLSHTLNPHPGSDINHRLAAIGQMTDESLLLQVNSTRALTKVEHMVCNEILFPPVNPLTTVSSSSSRGGRGGGRGGRIAEMQSLVIDMNRTERPDRPKSQLKKHVWMHARINNRAFKSQSSAEAASTPPMSEIDQKIFDQHFDLMAYLDGPSITRLKVEEGQLTASADAITQCVSFFSLNELGHDRPVNYEMKMFAYGKEICRYASMQQLLALFTSTESMKRLFKIMQSLDVKMSAAALSVPFHIV
jgi:hypothetical protein